MIYYPVEVVGPLLLFAAGFALYFALFAAVLYYLNPEKGSLAARMAYFLLGASIGFFMAGVLVLLSR